MTASPVVNLKFGALWRGARMQHRSQLSRLAPELLLGFGLDELRSPSATLEPWRSGRERDYGEGLSELGNDPNVGRAARARRE